MFSSLNYLFIFLDIRVFSLFKLLGHIKKIVGDRPLIFPKIGRAGGFFFIFYSCLTLLIGVYAI